MACMYETLYKTKLEEMSDLRVLYEMKDKELTETKQKLMVATAPKGSDVGDWKIIDAQ